MDLNPVSIIGGILAAAAVQFAKDHPKVPLDPDDADKIKKILAFFGALIAVGIAYLDGKLADGTVNWGEAATIVANFLGVVWSAYLAYQVSMKKAKPAVVEDPETIPGNG